MWLRRLLLIFVIVGFGVVVEGRNNPVQAKSNLAQPPKPTIPAWQLSGIDGGEVQNIYISPSNPEILYAYMPLVGLYRSQDGGTTWHYRGLKDAYEIISIKIDPQNSDVLYHISGHTYFETLARSDDGGQHWVRLTNGLPRNGYPDRITSFAIDPLQSSTLYVTLMVDEFPEQEGLYRSTDGGQHWAFLQTNLPIPTTGNDLPAFIVADPQHAGTLYFMGNDILYKSENGGGYWVIIREELPIDYLQFDPFDSRILYAGNRDRMIIRSENGGITWVPVETSDLPSNYTLEKFLVDPQTSNTLYALLARFQDPLRDRELYRKVEDGPWMKIDTTLPSSTILDIAIRSDGVGIYAATSFGIFRTFDGGIIWEPATTGIENLTVVELKIDPFDSNILYATTGSAGLYKSEDGALTWSLINFSAHYVFSIAIHPTTPNIIYAAAYGTGIYKSIDGGVNWELTGSLWDPFITSVHFDPINPNILYAVNIAGIYRTVNAGKTWELRSPTWISGSTDFAIAPYNTNILLATAPRGYMNGSDLYRSTDGGVTWKFGSGFPCHEIPDYPEPYIYCATITDIEFDPHEQETVYATVIDRHSESNSGSGIYKSTDGGATWTIMSNSPNPHPYSLGRTITVDPITPQTLYFTDAGNSSPQRNASFQYSLDGGVTWHPINAGLIQDRIFTLTVHSDANTTIYLGGGRGVYSQTFWYGTYLPIVERGKP